MVDESVLQGLLGREPVVAVGVGNDLLHRVPGVGRGDLSELLLHLDDEVGVDADVGCRAPGTTGGLVHEHAGMRGEIALALGAGRQQVLPHGGGQPRGHGGDVGLDVLHGVVDGHAGGHRAAGAVDVEVDVPLGILGGQQQHLGADGVGVVITHLGAEPDDALLEEAVVDGVGQPQTRASGVGCLGRCDRSGCIELAHVSPLMVGVATLTRCPRPPCPPSHPFRPRRRCAH